MKKVVKHFCQNEMFVATATKMYVTVWADAGGGEVDWEAFGKKAKHDGSV